MGNEMEVRYQKALRVALGAVRHGGDVNLVTAKVAEILRGEPRTIPFAAEQGGIIRRKAVAHG